MRMRMRLKSSESTTSLPRVYFRRSNNTLDLYSDYLNHIICPLRVAPNFASESAASPLFIHPFSSVCYVQIFYYLDTSRSPFDASSDLHLHYLQRPPLLLIGSGSSFDPPYAGPLAVAVDVA